MEKWKDIKGYAGLYQISNLGRVKSVCRKVDTIIHNASTKMIVSERILAHTKYRYSFVRLSKNGISNGFLVHRLVALAFIPNPNRYKQINHKNGIKTDNRIENLEWCTASQNGLHAYKTGLSKSVNGSKVNGAKLSEEDAWEILQLHKMYGINQTKTAKEYGLCQATIGELIRRETWKHLQI